MLVWNTRAQKLSTKVFIFIIIIPYFLNYCRNERLIAQSTLFGRDIVFWCTEFRLAVDTEKAVNSVGHFFQVTLLVVILKRIILEYFCMVGNIVAGINSSFLPSSFKRAKAFLWGKMWFLVRSAPDMLSNRHPPHENWSFFTDSSNVMFFRLSRWQQFCLAPLRVRQKVPPCSQVFVYEQVTTSLTMRGTLEAERNLCVLPFKPCSLNSTIKNGHLNI